MDLVLQRCPMEHQTLLFWLAERFGVAEYVNEWVASIAASIVVLIVLSAASAILWQKIRHTDNFIDSTDKFSLYNIFEIVVDSLLGVMRSVMGDAAEKFFPLIGTLFVYILCCNLLGFIPGMMSPTTVITTNLACALVVFGYYNYAGIRELGARRYFRHFLGPVVWLAPLFLLVELISHFVRPLSLSVRLYGNMMGDHIVLGVFSDLTPLIIPMFFILFGIFVSLIQAFVFSFLSTVYIALAIQHE